MIRILIFILAAAFFAFVTTALLSVDGRFTAEAFGSRYDIHTGAALFAVAAVIVFSVLVLHFVSALSRLPDAMRGAVDEGARARGLEALTRGFEALAVGDGETALREAAIAERKLRDVGLTRLLRAQASLLAGDARGAQESFSAMLAAPATEFLGLRGLFLQAERAGDLEAARSYATRAFALDPHAQWAFQSLFAGGLERGAWGEMRKALATARVNGAIDAEKGRRGEAALLAADAAAAAASGDEGLALEEAGRALKLAPDFTPAAALAARLLAARRGKFMKPIERAFARAPHAALVDAANALLSDERAEKRAQTLEKLAAEAPQSAEATLARARARIAVKDFAGAAALIEPLLREKAVARLCTLMAEIAIASGGPDSEVVARGWLGKAAAAPREPDFSRGGVDLSRQIWVRTIREYMETGRLAPLSLDAGEAEGVSDEEMKRLSLLAPPKEEAGKPDGDVAPAERAAEAPAEPAAAAGNPDKPAPDGKSESDALLAGDRVSAARAIAAAGEVS